MKLMVEVLVLGSILGIAAVFGMRQWPGASGVFVMLPVAGGVFLFLRHRRR